MEGSTRPDVRRGRRIGPARLLRCALTVTVANIMLPPREWVTRWRRTVPVVFLYVLAAVDAAAFGASWPAAAILALPIVAGSLVAIFMAQVWLGVGGVDQLWHVCAGPDTAVIVGGVYRGRRTLHSWSAWRQRRGLGRCVVAAAFAEFDRPFWVHPATPPLRELYLRHGGQPDPDGGDWIVVPER